MDLINGDCIAHMLTMPESSVDLIATDPPYFKVKPHGWDRQWSTASGFIDWCDVVLEQFERILRPNGSLYWFASPQMSWHVEGAIRQRFNVLCNIRWEKEQGFHRKAPREALRSYFPNTDTILFAEHHGSDNAAKGEAGYNVARDKARGFIFEPLRRYICDEFERAGMLNTAGKIAANIACGCAPHSAGTVGHYLAKSQWLLPTAPHYEALRKLLNNTGGDYLRRDYESLRLEYEALRLEYEALRRPFNASPSAPYTDVWHFDTVKNYRGKHPCEKPLDLMQHIIKTSSNPGAVVFDPFMGSGTTGAAAVSLGRRFIGCELDSKYYDSAAARIASTATKEAQQKPAEARRERVRQPVQATMSI